MFKTLSRIALTVIISALTSVFVLVRYTNIEFSDITRIVTSCFQENDELNYEDQNNTVIIQITSEPKYVDVEKINRDVNTIANAFKGIKMFISGTLNNELNNKG